MNDAEIYARVIGQWQRIKDVAAVDGRTPTTIRAAVHREFRRRHPQTWERLTARMTAADEWYRPSADRPVPFLWHLRAYEQWRVIAKPPVFYREGLSSSDSPESLLFNWKWLTDRNCT